jgi:hypothetical protein
MRARSEGVTWRKVDSQIVILDLEDSCYLRTNAVGAVLWERLQTESSLEELVTLLVETYEVDEETASRDTKQFIEDLAANNLLTEPLPE